MTTTEERIETLVEAIRAAGNMYVIREALDRATGIGDIWPQAHDFPNPAFVLVLIHLLKRDSHHAHYAAALLTEHEVPA